MTTESLVHQAIPVASTAAALLLIPDRRTARIRLTALADPPRPARSRPSDRRRTGRVVLAWHRIARHRPPPADRLHLAAAWDVLAACLHAGLPVPAAVDAAAGEVTGSTASTLRRVADELRLGAEPADAWAPAQRRPELVRLARRARRAARSGTALAEAATSLAAELRADVQHAAESGAQRAGVLITAPLGLCFLPAFVCLGIAPVVLGLATRLLPAR